MEENEVPEENNLDHLEFDSPTPLEHEMFKALLKVDFTERQALQLVAFLMAEAMEDGGVNLFFDETFFKEMNKDKEEEDDGQDS